MRARGVISAQSAPHTPPPTVQAPPSPAVRALQPAHMLPPVAIKPGNTKLKRTKLKPARGR
eukprot:6969927-Prymnesium_polylepis.1